MQPVHTLPRELSTNHRHSDGGPVDSGPRSYGTNSIQHCHHTLVDQTEALSASITTVNGVRHLVCTLCARVVSVYPEDVRKQVTGA